jgi:hypothetical protein
MVKIGSVRFKGVCKRHPRFDPMEGAGAVRGGCRCCLLLLEIHQAHGKLVELIRQSKNELEDERPRRGASSLIDSRQQALF